MLISYHKIARLLNFDDNFSYHKSISYFLKKWYVLGYLEIVLWVFYVSVLLTAIIFFQLTILSTILLYIATKSLNSLIYNLMRVQQTHVERELVYNLRLPYKIPKFRLFLENYKTYVIDLVSFAKYVVRLFIVSAYYFFILRNTHFAIFFIGATILMAALGLIFSKIAVEFRMYLLNGQKVPKILYFLRLAMPNIVNLLDIEATLLIVIMSQPQWAKYGLVLYILSVLAEAWSVRASFGKLLLNWKLYEETLNLLREYQNKFVFNEAGYKKVAELCKPTKFLLQKSRDRETLILKNYEPIKQNKKTHFVHIINFTFSVGKIYQLNGVNGIGKTVFLKSLSLPSEELVPYPKGEAAFLGQPLFNSQNTLKAHRQKIVYIGANSIPMQLLKKLVNRIDMRQYPHLKTFLLNIQKMQNKKENYSEGTKGIINILTSLHNPQVKIILIDEILSRVYNSPEYPLRTELTKYLKEKTSKTNKLIIVVDHNFKIKEAVQIEYVRKKDIFTIIRGKNYN